MADEKEILGLDLDPTGFIEGADKASKALDGAFDQAKVAGIDLAIVELAKKLTIVGVAALALKATFDGVFEGEQIKQTNALFDDLTNQFGLAGAALKEDLIKAAGGLSDTQELTVAANKAIIELGVNAAKLPQIMDMARKLTVAFGGDATERFEQITQAVATGNTRILKHMGIIIDTNKALQDFAAAQGVSASALSETGRQQAILNAVLAYGDKNLKDVGNNVNTATSLWNQLKTVIKEFGEIASIVFEKILGPSISNALSKLVQFGGVVKSILVDKFGEGTEKASAHVDALRSKLSTLFLELNTAKKANWFDKLFGQGTDADIARIEKKIKETQSEITKGELASDNAIKKSREEAAKAAITSNKALLVDSKKASEEKVKFEKELVKLQEQNATEGVKLAQNETQLKAAQNARKLALERQFRVQMQELDKQYPGDNPEFAKRKYQLGEQYKKQHEEKLAAIERNRFKEQLQMQQNMLESSKTASEGFENAWKTHAMAATVALNDFGARGKQVVDSIQKNGETAFQSFGESVITHSKSASEIMKGFFLNTLADIAEAQGKIYLAMGFVDPTKAAAGAGLLVLSGILRALAGSSGSSGGIGGGGGGGGGTSSPAQNNSQVAPATPQAQLVVQVQGDFLSTEESQRKILQIVRDATDSTDFKYVQIGST